MVPKLTQPLAKAIRTLEGIVLAASATVPWIVSLVNVHTLPPSVAVKWSAASAIALGVSRTALKVVAAVKGATGIQPMPVDIEALAASVAAKIDITHLPNTDQVKAMIDEAIKLALEAAGTPPPTAS